MEDQLNSVEGKNDKELNWKRKQVLSRLLKLPTEQRFKSFMPGRKNK